MTHEFYVQILKDAKVQEWMIYLEALPNKRLVYSISIPQHSPIITSYCLLSLYMVTKNVHTKIWHQYR